jgi:hypothetical protein
MDLELRQMAKREPRSYKAQDRYAAAKAANPALPSETKIRRPSFILE